MQDPKCSRIVDDLILVARAKLSTSQRAILAARLTVTTTYKQQVDAIFRSLKAAVR
jgi:hypothetical protein